MIDHLTSEDILHFAHASKQLDLLNGWDRRFLYSIGKWYWPDRVSPKQRKIFVRLYGELQQFSTNAVLPCSPKCPSCAKLLDHTRKTPRTRSTRPWRLKKRLYPWQKSRLEEWLQAKHGILKVVTGAGKTVFALATIAKITKGGQDEQFRVFVVVPTEHLLHQWKDKLIADLNVKPSEIGLFYGKEKGDYINNRIQIYVINTARNTLAFNSFALKLLGHKTYLIADECHHYGSKENARLFGGMSRYDYTLGLSATPETYSHFGYDDVLLPNLGELLETYSYADALKDGIISPFQLIYCPVKLTDDEKSQYEEISERILGIKQKLENRYPTLKRRGRIDYFKLLGYLENSEDDEEIGVYKGLLNKRMSILHESESRWFALNQILNRRDLISEQDQILIFHERISFAERIHEQLKDSMTTEIYHSQLNPTRRNEALQRFGEGYSRCLVAVKALDEGIDVPRANVAILMASTKGIRQRIQRIGRVLRKAGDKPYCSIFTIYVPEYESDIFETEEYKEMEGVAGVSSIDL